MASHVPRQVNVRIIQTLCVHPLFAPALAQIFTGMAHIVVSMQLLKTAIIIYF